MKDKIKINIETGLMIDVVHPLEFGDDIIETPCNIPYHLPRWNGESWEEGATQAEINAIKASATAPETTPTELLQAEIADLKARLAKVEAVPIVKTALEPVAEKTIT